MCRSIKVLRRPDEPATPEELSGAARQFVRKISGFSKPSKANQEAFELAVSEITASSDRLLKSIAEKQKNYSGSFSDGSGSMKLSAKPLA